MLHETLDRAALAGRVAALEDDHDFLAGHFDPVLYFQQLDLQQLFLLLVDRARYLVRIGVLPFPEQAADGLGVLAQASDDLGAVGAAEQVLLLFGFLDTDDLRFRVHVGPPLRSGDRGGLPRDERKPA